MLILSKLGKELVKKANYFFVTDKYLYKSNDINQYK